MLASYGYEDGTGVYYITIDTDKCEECDGKGCIGACSQDVFILVENDWGDAIVAIEDEKTNLLKSCCLDCMILRVETKRLPCQAACPYTAIRHTW